MVAFWTIICTHIAIFCTSLRKRGKKGGIPLLALDRHDFVVSVESIERLLAMHDDDSEMLGCVPSCID